MSGRGGSKAKRKGATSHARAGRAKQAARPTTLAEQASFLAHFAELGVLTAAAQTAGIDRKRHYEWLAQPEKYPAYRAQYEDAYERACDVLEAEATRRAVEGWEEPVFGSGGNGKGTVQVGTVRKFSDRMLEIMLKARRPDRFRERHTIEYDLTKLSDEQLRRLVAGEDPVAVVVEPPTEPTSQVM